MAKSSSIHVHVWSEHFLGTRAKGEELLAVVETMDGGLWLPDRWGHFEPIQSPYGRDSRDAMLHAWTEVRGGRISNDLNFRKRRPRASIYATAWRSKVPDLNRIWLDLEAKPFEAQDGVARLMKIVLDLVAWSNGVHATVRHSDQALYRIVQKTPLERLQQLDWLTFFGKPYVEMFGEKRLLETPCYRVERALNGFLLLAAARPDDPEMTETDRVLVRLEDYLGSDAFAGRGYPSVPCKVPRFELLDTLM